MAAARTQPRLCFLREANLCEVAPELGFKLYSLKNKPFLQQQAPAHTMSVQCSSVSALQANSLPQFFGSVPIKLVPAPYFFVLA